MRPAALNGVPDGILIAIEHPAPLCATKLQNKANVNVEHYTSVLLIRSAQSMTLITLCLLVAAVALQH